MRACGSRYPQRSSASRVHLLRGGSVSARAVAALRSGAAIHAVAKLGSGPGSTNPSATMRPRREVELEEQPERGGDRPWVAMISRSALASSTATLQRRSNPFGATQNDWWTGMGPGADDRLEVLVLRRPDALVGIGEQPQLAAVEAGVQHHPLVGTGWGHRGEGSAGESASSAHWLTGTIDSEAEPCRTLTPRARPIPTDPERGAGPCPSTPRSEAGSAETGGSRRRGGRPIRQAPEGAPNVVLIVLDDVGYAQLGCYGSDIATPNIDRLAAGGVRLANFHTTALCSPTRSCLLTGRNHHSQRHGPRRRPRRRATPATGAASRAATASCPRSSPPTGTRRSRSASGTSPPRTRPTWPRPADSWPLGRGFQRWYGFHGGETHQFVPNLFQDNHAVLPPRTPEEGYHLSEDLADRAIQYLGEHPLGGRRPTVLPLLRHRARATPRTTRRPSGSSATAASSTAAGTRGGSATFARQQAMGLLPAGTELSPRPHWVPAWDGPRPRGPGGGGPVHGVLRRLPLPRRRADRPAARLHRRPRRARQHDRRPRVGQRRERRRRRATVRSTTRGCGTATRPVGEELRERIDELGDAHRAQQLPVGLDDGGQHAVPALEARGPRGWHRRPVHRQLAARAIAARGEIRHQFAHAIDVLPDLLELIGIDAPDRARRLAQSPIEGTSFAHLLPPDGRAPSATTTQYFEMLGSRGIYHDGWKAVTFKPLGGDVRRRHRSGRAVRGRRLGAVPRRRGPLGVPRPRGRGARAAGGDGRAVVGRGAHVPGAAARQPARRRVPATRAEPYDQPRPLRVLARTARRSPRT